MKILFLDIDGVLNSRAYDRKRNWNEQTDIDETRLPLVREIIDKTGAKIVLISTWRSHWNRDENLISKYGLAIYDKTPDLGLLSKRKDEVKAWLAEHAGEVENFVILDDYRFGWDDLSDFYIHTNPHYGLGLEEEHVEKAIALLNG